MTGKYRFLLLLLLCAGLTCELPGVSAQTGGGKYDGPRGLSGSDAAAVVRGDGAAATLAGGVSALAGKWVGGYIPESTWTYTGSYAGGDGTRHTYQFSPDGTVWYTGVMSFRANGCSQTVLTTQKGRAQLSGDTLTIKWSRGFVTRDVFCERANTYKETARAQTETRKVVLKNSSTGRRQFCFVSDGGEICFTRAE